METAKNRIDTRLVVCKPDQSTLIIVSGIPGVGKTARLRSLADYAALYYGHDEPVMFFDTDIMGQKIDGRFFVDVEEVKRLLALVKRQGVKHFILGGTCANFGALLYGLKSFDVKRLLILECDPERHVEVMEARGVDSASDDTGDGEVDLSAADVIPDTVETSRAWMLTFRSIAMKQAERHGFETFIVDIDGSVGLMGISGSPKFKDASGYGNLTVRAVKRAGYGDVEFIRQPDETPIYAGYTYLCGKEPVVNGIVIPKTLSVFDFDYDDELHHAVLDVANLGKLNNFKRRDDL